jgi:acetyl-CoA C-acetyltransferase
MSPARRGVRSAGILLFRRTGTTVEVLIVHPGGPLWARRDDGAWSIRKDHGATVPAGNASGQNDGAAVRIVTHADRAAELNLKPVARLVSWASAGVPPRTMGIGPVPATAKAIARAGLTLADMDLIELNEAFAAQVLAVLREWDLPDGLERVNVNGSGISLGHPIGATGGRILTTLLPELVRRGGRYGPETMCIGGGQGLAAVFENVRRP